MASNRPRTFAELVTALEPEERARLERGESYDDPAVAVCRLHLLVISVDRWIDMLLHETGDAITPMALAFRK